MFVYLIYHTSERRAGDFHIASSISTFSIRLISALFFSLKLITEESYLTIQWISDITGPIGS